MPTSAPPVRREEECHTGRRSRTGSRPAAVAGETLFSPMRGTQQHSTFHSTLRPRLTRCSVTQRHKSMSHPFHISLTAEHDINYTITHWMSAPQPPQPLLTPRSSSPPLSQVDPGAASEVHRNRRQLGPHAEKLPADAGQREADELDQPPGGAGGAPAADDAAEQHVVQQGGAGEVQAQLGPLDDPPERQCAEGGGVS